MGHPPEKNAEPREHEQGAGALGSPEPEGPQQRIAFDVRAAASPARTNLGLSAKPAHSPGPESAQEPLQPGEQFYRAVGGHAAFAKLVHEFYLGVKEDDVLRPMYPEEDMEGAERRLLLFLEQYWGGPKTYGEERGHPRLRMRHAPFAVTALARDRWLEHMRHALDTLNLPPLQESTLWDYLERAAHSMVNSA